ncbi:MAG: hypothetical protein JWO05_1230 [Gemmatimonadetes bacterium]|nr:hypothetical protein [Gemmatimonadota bacterium]
MRARALACSLVVAASTALPLLAQAPLDPRLFQELKYRMVGPSRGGRVTAVAGVASDPRTYYMGVASGGVFKTTDAGISWNPVSDGQISAPSIGAIEVSASNANVVYVGTGSDDIRSNVSTGRGVWRSSDAGRTWQFAGLRDVGQVGAVRVHPTNPDVAYVAAIGNAFTNNSERGVFRTRDGGKSWQKVLFLSDSVGAADLEMQPGNPDVLYAWMWRGQRKPWTIVSGAREGGFYRSTDAGDHWTKVTAGLPADLVGKAGLSVTAANPQRVYALIEAKPGSGVYRSDDAGLTWAVQSTQPALVQRPFYYVALTADPTNADVVYAGAESFFRSTDAGKTFRPFTAPHGDHHDMWINPTNGQVMIQSNDGGANVSTDGGRNWSTQYNQPTAEIYQVAVDEQYPYRLYGAQQDNTTVIVPSLPLASGRPDDPMQEWRQGPGCETGPIFPHLTNPDTVYGSCKGQFSRMSLRSGQEKQYWVGSQSLYGNDAKDLVYRFQRVSPMERSPFDARVLYYGSQYLHRTRDEGVTWERISPDLTAHPDCCQGASGEPITRDVTGEEFYSTLYSIRESPKAKGVIWTGSNDGPFYVTRNDGRSWANVTPKDMPPGGRVQNIEPSPHRAGSAYYAAYRYLLGDFHPYIWKTNDYGRTWTLLTTGSNGIPADEPTRVVREDPVREGLLYAGTEFGMYVSFDDGAHWQPFQLNLPNVPVTDIRVHRDDLVLSTQGRSFWILDDVSPLREAAASITGSSAHLFTPRAATRWRYSAGFGGLGRDVPPSANPQYPVAGANIDFWVGAGAGAVTIEVLDAKGALVRRFSSEVSDAAAVAPDASAPADEGAPRRGRGGPPRLDQRAGMHRFSWDMRYPGTWNSDANPAGNDGPLAPPGSYTVRLTAGGVTESRPLLLRMDPRAVRDGVTNAVALAQFGHNMRVRDLVSDANRLAARIQRARTRLRAAGSAGADSLARLSPIDTRFFGQLVRYGKPGLQANITYIYQETMGADQAVGRDVAERYALLRTQLDAMTAEVDRVLGAAGK